MKLSDSHLTYCTNIHAGESWAQVMANLRTHVVAVKAMVCPDRPFGVGLRLSAAAAQSLDNPSELEALCDFLNREGLYVFTLNGFPYGPFHGQTVKEEVYRPDWSADERSLYNQRLVVLLTRLLPDGMVGSISTVPGGFKADLREPDKVVRVAENLLKQVVDLHRLRESTGQQINLCLEPEPCCLLETTDETIDFFKRHLLSADALSWLSKQVGLSSEQSERVVRRHLGVCLDTCHAAIEFETADESLDRLHSAGLVIGKVQLSAGLKLSPTPEALAELARYDEPVYLHQVVARTAGGSLLRFSDLPAAFGDTAARAAHEWRVHFHVPIYRHVLGLFENTQGYLERVLERHLAQAVSAHLEVETYTWDVLPPEQRREDVNASIGRELSWVLERLSP
jgi:sugar phosphate isomerase/epimerase